MNPPPKLRLLLGPPRSGKAAVALAAYRDVLRAAGFRGRRRGLWLVPTQAAAGAARDALVASPADGLLDPGVATFTTFAASIAWDAGLRLRVISPLTRRRLLRQVITETAGAGVLEYYGPVADSPGLVSLVDDALAALGRRGVTVNAFRRQAKGADARRRDIARFYAAYQSKLDAAGLVDGQGLFRATRNGLHRTPELATGLDLVVVDGFTDFTSAEFELLALLVQRARQTWVTLDADPPAGDDARRELFVKTRGTIERLQQVAAADIEWHAPPGELWPGMVHLERNLFRDYRRIELPPATIDLTQFQVIAASGVQAEIEEVARRVKQRLLDGARPDEVVVAFRSCRDVADRVRQAFADFGIPLFLDAARRLVAAPLVRSLLAMLQLQAEDWPYRRVLQVTLDRTTRLLDDAQRRAVELCVRHAQIPKGGAALREQVAERIVDESDAETDVELAAPLALAAIDRLANVLAELPARASIAAWTQAAHRLTNRLGLLDDDAAPGAFTAWSALAHGLEAAAQIDQWTSREPESLSLAEFIELAATTAAELPAPDGRDAAGRVRVLPAEAARLTTPRHLYLAGLSEQSFPAAFTRDAEISRRVDPAVGDGDLRSDEMLLFYQLATRPIESLTLSYPALDAKGQTLPPSPFLMELQRTFGDVDLPRFTQPLNYRQRKSVDAAPLSKSDLRRVAVLRASDRHRELLAAAVAEPSLGDTGHSILDGIATIASRGGREFGPHDGLFAGEAVRAALSRRYDGKFTWSPSQLETYAACPFRFFGEQVLQLSPLPELALESDLARRGSLLHETLSHLYDRLRSLGAPPETPADVARHFEEALNDIAASRPRGGLDWALRDIERRQIAAWAELFARQHADYAAGWGSLDQPPTAAHFEVRFGPSRRHRDPNEGDLSTDESFAVEVGSDTIRFAGRIDRIDLGRVRETVVFNVIDYKTSAVARVKGDEIKSGRQIQLPLYAMAVAELLLAEQQATPLAAGYWSIRGKGFDFGGRSGGPLRMHEVREGLLVAATEWPALRKDLVDRIGAIVAGIRQGEFPVYNDDPNCGRYCPLTTICRITHVRSLEKTWTDARPPV